MLLQGFIASWYDVASEEYRKAHYFVMAGAGKTANFDFTAKALYAVLDSVLREIGPRKHILGMCDGLARQVIYLFYYMSFIL